jgi:hypothetical protein
MSFDLQPTLNGELLGLRPLRPEDFRDFFAVASDPLIWDCMEHVLEKWRTPLRDVGDDRLETPRPDGRRGTVSTRCSSTRSCIRFGMRSNSKS